MEITSEDFVNGIKKFYANEPRQFCYDLALGLIEKAKHEEDGNWYLNQKTTDAVLLIQFTWNFAWPGTKKLTHKQAEDCIKNNIEGLIVLSNYSIQDINLEEKKIPLKQLFDNFKKTFGQTGATKALSLLNPKLFVMWDTKIRSQLKKEIKKAFPAQPSIDNGETGDKYLTFLKYAQKKINGVVTDYANKKGITFQEAQERLSKDLPLAKKIDEYFYAKYKL